MTGSPTPPAADRAAGSEAAAGQRFAIAIGLLGVAGLAVTAPAQTPPAAPAITPTVVAGTKLASLDNTPVYFKAVSVSIPPSLKISFSAPPNGILYQLSGSTDLSAGEPKTITGGGGVIIVGGTTVSLTAGNGEQSTLLYFLLVPKEALDQPVAATPATVNELYRTAAPLPELKAGLPRSRWQILLGHLGEGFGRKTPLTVAHRSVRRQLAAGELGGSPADQPLSLGQGQHAGSLPSFDPGARSRAEGPAVLAKIAGSDAPPAQGSKIASVRTSIDSRGAASAGVSGNSKALCGVKRARSPRLSQPLISRTSSRSIFGA
jgi:hypothetical protein